MYGSHMASANCRPIALAIGIAVLSLVALVALSYRYSPRNKFEDEQAIRSAVIRKQMQDWYEKGAPDDCEAFIQIDGQDPSDEFLARLQGVVPWKIKRFSANPTTHNVLIFSADSILWLDADTVHAAGSFSCGNLCGSGSTFIVHRQLGQWVVEKEIVRSIS